MIDHGKIRTGPSLKKIENQHLKALASVALDTDGKRLEEEVSLA